MIYLLLLLPIVVGLCELIRRYINYLFTPLNRIPGEKTSFLWGSFWELRNERGLAAHFRRWKKVGVDTPLVHYTYLFGTQSVLVTDPDIIKTILLAPSEKVGKKSRFHKESYFLEQALGAGLVALDGVDYMRHRRICQPSFNTGVIRDQVNEVIPYLTKKFVEYWEIAADTGVEIDIMPHLSALSLDSVGFVLFGHDFRGMDSVKGWAEKTKDALFSGQKISDEIGKEVFRFDDPFIAGVMEAHHTNLVTIVLIVLGLASLDPYINPKRIRTDRVVNEATDNMIDNARTSDKNSLLKLLLQAGDPEDEKTKLTQEELRHECKTFLLAGHETTATLVQWTLLACCKHPDVQEKLVEDIRNHWDTTRDLTLDIAEKMEYMQAVINEVLRMYPPVAMIIRVNKEKETLGGYEIPAGTRLGLPMLLVHRHPKFWDKPDEFRPERWLENPEPSHRFAFFPFSAGSRTCIGNRFAVWEAKIMLAGILNAFKVQLAPSQRDIVHQFAIDISMKAEPSILILIKKR